MKIEESLCRVFCDGITVAEVPSGLAVATSFEDAIGDRIAFYIVRDAGGLYRIEDDGSLVPALMAMGSNVAEGQRARIFNTILAQSGVEYDDAAGELKTTAMPESEIPAAAMRFVSMLIRVAALSAMTPERVVNAFREDAIARIKADLSDKVSIAENEPISPEMAEWQPDLVLRPRAGAPVAVFIAVSDARLYEAIFLRMAADHEVHQPCSVVALLDREGTRLVTHRMRQRAQNRLDAMPVYYGEESAAVARIEKEFPTAARLQ